MLAFGSKFGSGRFNAVALQGNATTKLKVMAV